MAFSHPLTTLFTGASVTAGSTSSNSTTVDATAGAGTLVEIQATPSGTLTTSPTVQPYHSPDGSATFYPWGAPLYFYPSLPASSVAAYCDWQAPPEGGKWYFTVINGTGSGITVNGRATVITPG